MTIQTGEQLKELQAQENSHYKFIVKMRKRKSKVNVCLDCGEQSENEVYCDNCELRHLQFSQRVNYVSSIS